MHLVYDDGSGERDVEVLAREPDLVVAELALALGAPAGAAISVDGRTVDPGAPLTDAGLYDGAAVTHAPARRGARRRPSHGSREDEGVTGGPGEPAGVPPHPQLAVIGGLEAGRSWPVAAGATVVGRERGCDVVIAHPTVSAVHCRIDVRDDGALTVTDLGSHNGTWRAGDALGREATVSPGDVLRLGGAAVTVRVPPEDRAPTLDRVAERAAAGGTASTVTFDRPPRPGAPAGPAPLRCPATVPARGPAPPFSLVSFVAPLGLAAVMVVMLGDARFALFALLSPVMVVGNWLEGRRRNRKQARRARDDLSRELAEFLTDLDAAKAGESARRRATLVDPAEALRRAEAPSVRLWERRPAHDDLLRLVAGIGNLPWAPPLEEAGPRPDVVDHALEETRLEDVPVPVDLLDGPVALVGDRTAVLAVARSLVCQAATHAGPADVRVAVLTTPDGCAEWDWVKWLPHSAEPVSGRRMVIAERDRADDFLRATLDADGGPPGWWWSTTRRWSPAGDPSPGRHSPRHASGSAGWCSPPTGPASRHRAGRSSSSGTTSGRASSSARRTAGLWRASSPPAWAGARPGGGPGCWPASTTPRSTPPVRCCHRRSTSRRSSRSTRSTPTRWRPGGAPTAAPASRPRSAWEMVA